MEIEREHSEWSL